MDKARKLEIIKDQLNVLIDECRQMDISYKEINNIVKELFEED